MSEGHLGLTGSAGESLAEHSTSQNHDRDKKIDPSVETGTNSLGNQKPTDSETKLLRAQSQANLHPSIQGDSP
jgi:hypothetical protein